MPEDSDFVGKRRKSPRKMCSAHGAQKTKIMPNFWIFSKSQCRFLDKSGPALIHSIISVETNIQRIGPVLDTCSPTVSFWSFPRLFTQPTTMQILFWPLVLWDQPEIILGENKSQKPHENRVCWGKEKGTDFSQNCNLRRVFSLLWKDSGA